MRRINGDRDGSNSGEGRLQFVFLAGRDVDEASVDGAAVRRVVSAFVILKNGDRMS